MHPVELWWLLDARRPVRMYGDLTESDVSELYDQMRDGAN